MIGYIQLNQGDIHKALQAMEKVINIRPNNPLYVCIRGECYFKLENY